MDQGEAPSRTLLEEVLEQIGDTSGPLAGFARAYLQRIPWDADMSARPAYHEVLGLFEFIECRETAISVRASNPTIESHGYTAPGTVVEVHVDDSPFLVDSITNELSGYGLSVLRVLHPVIGTTRDVGGRLISIQPAGRSESRESVQHYVLDRRLEDGDLPGLEQRLESVITEVLLAVGDFGAMVERLDRMVELVHAGAIHYAQEEVDEAAAFIRWLGEDNFVFLGYREYSVVESPEGKALKGVDGSGLGILSDPARSKATQPVLLADLAPDLAARYGRGDLLVISKTNRLSVVHRRAKMDYVGIRIVTADGETVGEARLLGLFTSKAYMESVLRIPILRQKVAQIAALEDLIEGSHDHKAIVALVEGFPKDELFGLPTEDLRRVLVGLLALQERAKVRLFVRRDLLDRGVRILVAVPRDRYSVDLGRRLERLFLQRFGGKSVDHHLTLDRSDIARLHYTVWVPEGQIPDVAFHELDAEVAEITRSWAELVADELAGVTGRDKAKELVAKWAPLFPPYYATATELPVAAADIDNLERLISTGARAVVGLQNEPDGANALTRIALYETEGKRPLSELTPALEDMGLTVVEEAPTRLSGMGNVFIHDFGVLDGSGELLDLNECSARICATLSSVWQGQAESDSLNRLVLQAGLTYAQVSILRAYLTYWRRVSPIFTVRYFNDTLVAHPRITADLVRLFELRFDPGADPSGYDALRAEVVARLDAVPSLDQDRILRGLLRLIEATLRTNAYRPERGPLSFKLRSADVPDMPVPAPFVEVFVVCPEVEGIHLRAGLRARGGIRWSERREDYRTEVLGLMKAQVTKNAIIVPTGAKGGFVLRQTPTDPDEVAEAVKAGYELYIRGLLDVADTRVGDEVVHPPGVRVHDGPDLYLVVAADKGTARFSDLANSVAREYDFWLDDAFASGGATGYDHKGLGITARGAWKSLERHFVRDGVDPHRQEFTAIGIGDMSGDVFGNGVLGSRTMKLVAAFDHRHVFIDPDPDPAASYQERERLFALPRSSWADYDSTLISKGGGVFSRAAKQIELSNEARAALGTDVVRATPAELIRLVLCAPVDLLWNGGIGTYVKAQDETHDDVGDRANDAIRVNGSDLRIRVAVEGGNLGFTQRGRIEYARNGGRINADFIDNSGGVNCSDREVNLKILLRQAEREGELTRPERDALLQDMSGEVVAGILAQSLAQARLLGIEERVSAGRLDAYEQLMVSLERDGGLARDIEFLPSTQEMGERGRSGAGLTRPELAVLVAYAKRDLAEAVLATTMPDSKELYDDLAGYFPRTAVERFGHLVWDHPLRRELIAMLVANDVVDSQGPTFVSRLAARTGAGVAGIITAYRTARDLVGGLERRDSVEELFGTVDYDVWHEVMAANYDLVATLTRWFLRHGSAATDAGRPADFADMEAEIGEWGSLQWRLERSARADRLKTAGVPAKLARRTVLSFDLVHVPDIIEVAQVSGHSRVDVGRTFYRVGRVLGLDDLERTMDTMQLADPWQRWALQTVEDDLLAVRRRIAERILAQVNGRSVDDAVDAYLGERSAGVDRVAELVASLVSSPLTDPAPLLVAVRQAEMLAD